MDEVTARLTLAFVGEQEVHRNNSRALLEDFVDGWQKQHRKGEVKVILHDFRTDTLDDIEDWAATSGYEIVEESAGGIVTLLLDEVDARLILVGDPNDDDTLYAVAEEAAKYRIQIRSLINGLEKVVFDDDDFEDDLAGEGFHEVDVESGEGWADEDLTDEAAALLAAVPDVPDAPEADAPPDLDLLATLADDGTVEAQEEIKDIAAAVDIDVTPFETWVDAVAAIRGKTGEVPTTTVVSEEFFDGLNGSKEEYLRFAAQVPEPEENPTETGANVPTPSSTDAEPAPEEVVGEIPDTGTDDEAEECVEEAVMQKAYTREELEAKSFDEVKAIALDHGVPPGRGMTHKVFITKILQATGVETDPPKRKRKTKMFAIAEPAAGEATEAKPADSTHEGATITPINETTLTGKSLLALAVRLQEIVDELQSLI